MEGDASRRRRPFIDVGAQVKRFLEEPEKHDVPSALLIWRICETFGCTPREALRQPQALTLDVMAAQRALDAWRDQQSKAQPPAPSAAALRPPPESAADKDENLAILESLPSDMESRFAAFRAQFGR